MRLWAQKVQKTQNNSDQESILVNIKTIHITHVQGVGWRVPQRSWRRAGSGGPWRAPRTRSRSGAPGARRSAPGGSPAGPPRSPPCGPCATGLRTSTSLKSGKKQIII